MLSLQHCRKLVGPECELSDEELATVREQFYSLASLALDMRHKGVKSSPRPAKTNKTSNCFGKALRFVADDTRAEIEERAAIAEYDGNLARDEAERAPIAMTVEDNDD